MRLLPVYFPYDLSACCSGQKLAQQAQELIYRIARRLSVLKFGNKRVLHDFRDAFSADLSLRYLQHTGTIAGFGLIAVDDKILIYLRAVIVEGVFCTV